MRNAKRTVVKTDVRNAVGTAMRSALAPIAAAALAAIAASLPGPAQARVLLPDVPYEIGVRRIGSVGEVPFRCSDGPAYNYYHGAFMMCRRRCIAATPTGPITATPPIA